MEDLGHLVGHFVLRFFSRAIGDFDCLAFDPISSHQYGATAEVDVGRCEIAEAFVITVVVVMADEGFDPGLEVCSNKMWFLRAWTLEPLRKTSNHCPIASVASE